ncbi:hypothetical protein C5Y93_17235 [Blastopirellula marina]|uniref:Uncharacterized protein n=1 Tax=Blastopirellula marina TaxID=124 RepID=A0A2S8GK68_9BACT|nr:hypothetical protein C5Y93_17235 [Blastopirellula marina]
MLAYAIGLGWYRDHTEAEWEMEQLPKEIAVLDGMLQDLQQRLSSSRFDSTEVQLETFSTENATMRSDMRGISPGVFHETAEAYL